MAPTREELLEVAKRVSFEIPDHELDDYEILLVRTEKTLATVAAMDDYQPEHDKDATLRTNIFFPQEADNPFGAWAWRFKLSSKNPTKDSLRGKELCLKDNICVAGVPCLLGTDTFRDWIPKSDATIVTRIVDAGGIITGKAVCENLSRGAVSVTAATGPVHNPYKRGYSVGGSSSGTAALVASGATDMGIGCDQGGSIRIPSALAGLYGFKPTRGLVPYTGIVSNDASLDYVGPMTNTCLENALLLEVIAGADGLDDRAGPGTPFPGNVPPYSTLTKQSAPLGIRDLKIGVLREGLPENIEPCIKAKFEEAVEVFRKLGADVQDISIPLHSQGRTLYSVLSKMGNYMGTIGHATGRMQVMLNDLADKKQLPYSTEAVGKMSAMSKDGLLGGNFAWQRYANVYPKAVNIMRKLKDNYDDAFKSLDLLIMPTTLCPAKPLPASDASPIVQMDAAKGMTENTCTFNATGHPALAMPIGFVPAENDNALRLPASMQIVSKWHDEIRIYQAAYAWETAVNWKET